MYLQEWLDLLSRESVRFIGNDMPYSPTQTEFNWYWMCKDAEMRLLDIAIEKGW